MWQRWAVLIGGTLFLILFFSVLTSPGNESQEESPKPIMEWSQEQLPTEEELSQVKWNEEKVTEGYFSTTPVSGSIFG